MTRVALLTGASRAGRGARRSSPRRGSSSSSPPAAGPSWRPPRIAGAPWARRWRSSRATWRPGPPPSFGRGLSAPRGLGPARQQCLRARPQPPAGALVTPLPADPHDPRGQCARPARPPPGEPRAPRRPPRPRDQPLERRGGGRLPRLGRYGSSKAALDLCSRTLASELRPVGDRRGQRRSRRHADRDAPGGLPRPGHLRPPGTGGHVAVLGLAPRAGPSRPLRREVPGPGRYLGAPP